MVDVVTAGAESGGIDLGHFDRIGVDRAPLFSTYRIDIILAAFDYAFEFAIVMRTVYRRVDISFFGGHAAADLAVGNRPAVANDAGNAFPRDRMPVHAGHKNIFIHVQPDRCVATHTKVTVGPVGQDIDLALHRIIYGADDRVRVRRHRPFFVVDRMAGFATRCGGNRTLIEKGLVGIRTTVLGPDRSRQA